MSTCWRLTDVTAHSVACPGLSHLPENTQEVFTQNFLGQRNELAWKHPGSFHTNITIWDKRWYTFKEGSIPYLASATYGLNDHNWTQNRRLCSPHSGACTVSPLPPPQHPVDVVSFTTLLLIETKAFIKFGVLLRNYVEFYFQNSKTNVPGLWMQILEGLGYCVTQEPRSALSYEGVTSPPSQVQIHTILSDIVIEDRDSNSCENWKRGQEIQRLKDFEIPKRLYLREGKGREKKAGKLPFGEGVSWYLISERRNLSSDLAKRGRVGAPFIKFKAGGLVKKKKKNSSRRLRSLFSGVGLLGYLPIFLTSIPINFFLWPFSSSLPNLLVLEWDFSKVEMVFPESSINVSIL